MFCRALLALAGASVLLLGPGVACGADSRRPNLLIAAEELAQPEFAKRARVLDVRPWQQYASRHVAGAVWVDFAAWDQASVHGKDVSFWEKRIGDLGIERSTPVVIYDNGSCRDAATIWWILRYWGVDDVRLLDAGWPGWLFARKPQQRKVPQVAPRAILLELQYTRRAAKSEVLKIAQSGQEQLIDVRSNDEIRGIVSRAARAGAIPSARHFDSSECLEQYQNLWRVKSAEGLTRVFKKAGIDPTQPVTIYGQSGDRGGFLAFSLELTGATNVRVYYRGWDEWGNAKDTPIRRSQESSEKALIPAPDRVTPL
jgi:thiosulfate/3-mercaptopyruvate sulfurtransferase